MIVENIPIRKILYSSY